jgi:hypothetical protein
VVRADERMKVEFRVDKEMVMADIKDWIDARL